MYATTENWETLSSHHDQLLSRCNYMLSAKPHLIFLVLYAEHVSTLAQQGLARTPHAYHYHCVP